MRCSSSSSRRFSGLLRSDDASKTVQREVKPTSRAKSRMTRPNRRRIGTFIGGPSTHSPGRELAELEAAHQVGGVVMGTQRVVEQAVAQPGWYRARAHPGDVIHAVE